MASSLPGYDAWLERPFQDMCAESDRYYDWCESHDLDPDSPASEAAYEDFCDDLAEQWAEEQAERHADRDEDDFEDWGYDEW